MFSSIQAFISRHRRKFLFGSVFIGGAFLLSNYGKKLLKERQERETKELFERNRKQHHFLGIEELCNKTALKMMPLLKNSIIQELDTEELINNLRDKAENKIFSWEKLKILSFARVITTIYAASILMVTLRIQLNLIGGYIFRDLADKNEQFTATIEGKYLSFCDHFIANGIKKLGELITEKLNLFLEAKSLKADMKLYDIENIFRLVQSSIAEDPRNPCKKIAEYVLPEQYRGESFATDNEVLDQIVRDTKDMFESNDVSYSISFCLDQGKMVLLETMKELYREKGRNAPKNNKLKQCSELTGTLDKDSLFNLAALNDSEPFVDCTKISIPMAKLIPMVNGLVQNGKNDMSDKWMLELVMMDRLKVLGANVYETFSSKVERA